ncbi:MAG: type II secretion system F family protein [Patescibacteria group bacterium]
MPVYSYKARTKEGEDRTGSIEASSKDAAIERLIENGWLVTSVEEAARGPVVFSVHLNFRLTPRVRQKDLVVFTRELAVLFTAHVPILEALETLAREFLRPSFQEVLRILANDIKGGLVLSQAMAKHPDAFSPFYVSMVRSGEESGQLLLVFTYLAEYLERYQKLVMKVRNAMLYPAFIIAAFIGVIIIMMVVVIPDLIPIFEELGEKPPIFVRLVFFLSAFLRKWGIFVALLASAGGVWAWRWSRTPKGRGYVDRLILHSPIIGVLFRKFFVARLTDNLRTLIAGGIPILHALDISGDVVGNRVYQDAMIHAQDVVRGGGTVAAAFEDTPEIPALATQMIRIGETSGRLDAILENLAMFYRQEVEIVVDNLVALIEPALLVVLGGGIGFFVISILGALYNVVGKL